MNEHVTEEALRRAMSGQEPDAKLALLRHLASCEECAAIGRRVAENDLQAMTRHLTSALDDADADALHAQRHRRARIYAIAASVASAAPLSGVVIMTRRPAQEQPIAARPPASSTQPTPTTTAATTTTREIDPELQQLVARAVEQRTLPFPAVLATLSMPGDVSRGRTVDAKHVSPAGVILEESRPRFSWPSTKNATYVVFVFDGEREVMQSKALSRNEWTPATDLPRGRTLAWQVEIRVDGATSILPSPPAPPALFRVITRKEARDLARAKTLHGDDPLLLAVLYARSGLRNAALEQLRLAAGKGSAGAEQILRKLDDN